MKQDIEVKVFKNELANYRFYKSKSKKLKSKLDECYDLLPGSVRGNDPSKLPMLGGVPNKDFEYKIRDEIELYESKLGLINDKIKYIDEILAKIDEPIKSAIISKYVHSKTLEQVANQMFITSMGLLKQINKAIKKALDD